ncbi:MAG: response regulator [Fuerstiella sp.]
MNESSEANTTATLHARILLVEDAIDDQRLILRVLAKAGADVTLECHGQAGVDRVKKAESEQQQFDLILMDMEMPILDGIEATRQIREFGFTGPIIAVTAHDSDALRATWSEGGCDKLMTKPLVPNALIQCVAEFQVKDVSTV